MPNPAAIRDRLPITVTTKDWSCCGTKGITITEAHGMSQWLLCATCNTCGQELAITKRWIAKVKKE